MKVKFLLPVLASIFFAGACSNNSSSTESTSPGVGDSTTTNPASDAMDYHNDQRQRIPTPDSSNVIGTDTISGTEATPNTGTNKQYNNQKGDSTKKE
ncbi:hypothetical protein [Parafilimonas terrae]|uniref:Lipoprotein n=1 Tax=Parafilimonas terrae TaxID=1465490 RepID=A0A1I5YX88_9BACT|nr:hypothetical protein [Parafilimonas terrae]SFQ48740.1 hypothetical protein SAMN05444277_114115 [Parafilimonas terrae]